MKGFYQENKNKETSQKVPLMGEANTFNSPDFSQETSILF